MKVAVVTGSGSGIGREIAVQLAKQGYALALLSRREDALQETAAIIREVADVRTLVQACDVRHSDSVTQAIEAVRHEFGRIDVLVNNAGLGVGHRIEDCPESDWDLVMDTCAKGTFLLTQAALPLMKADGCEIINIASQAAKHGYAEAGPYCAAKFAVRGFGLALQEEVREYGIRVHSLCPGLVQVPKPEHAADRRKGWLQVDDLANAVIYLLQQPKRVKLEDIGLFGFSADF